MSNKQIESPTESLTRSKVPITKHAGQGGMAGEYVTSNGPIEFKAGEKVEIMVGKSVGLPGKRGEDTILRHSAPDGKILNEIIAKGGEPVIDENNPPLRLVTQDDIQKGFTVTSLLLAECIHARNGLIDLLCASWQSYDVLEFPCECQFPFFCAFSMGELESETAVEITVDVLNPKDVSAFNRHFRVHRRRGHGPVTLHNEFMNLKFLATESGVWSVRVASGDILLGRLPIEIKAKT